LGMYNFGPLCTLRRIGFAEQYKLRQDRTLIFDLENYFYY